MIGEEREREGYICSFLALDFGFGFWLWGGR
jgi:hypothetical protein